MVPYLPFLVVFGLLPMIYAFYLAVTNDVGGWVGIANFTRTVRDSVSSRRSSTSCSTLACASVSSS